MSSNGVPTELQWLKDDLGAVQSQVQKTAITVANIDNRTMGMKASLDGHLAEHDETRRALKLTGISLVMRGLTVVFLAGLGALAAIRVFGQALIGTLTGK